MTFGTPIHSFFCAISVNRYLVLIAITITNFVPNTLNDHCYPVRTASTICRFEGASLSVISICFFCFVSGVASGEQKQNWISVPLYRRQQHSWGRWSTFRTFTNYIQQIVLQCNSVLVASLVTVYHLSQESDLYRFVSRQLDVRSQTVRIIVNDCRCYLTHLNYFTGLGCLGMYGETPRHGHPSTKARSSSPIRFTCFWYSAFQYSGHE